jgi:hypothetical protein
LFQIINFPTPNLKKLHSTHQDKNKCLVCKAQKDAGSDAESFQQAAAISYMF